MPTLNLGQVRPVYRGAWNSIDTYSAYDFVIYNGSAYLALKDVPANYEPPNQTKYWVLFGAKGEPGTPGEDGVDGAQGERGPSPAYRWDGTFLSIQNPDGTWPDQGIDLQGPAVPLSNSVTSTSETDAASSKAVNIVYDLANSKQANLGFTPVQQGGGAGQEGQKIYIGWSPSGLKAQADVLDLGNVVTTSAGCTKAPSAATADLATTATRLRLTGGVDTSWTYAGKGGQPAFVWGSDNGVNMDVWSPSNFNVASANISGRAQLAVPAVQWVVNLSGPAITVPSGGTYDVVCIAFNNSGGKGAVKYYPGTAGGTVISNSPTDYFVAGLCARVA